MSVQEVFVGDTLVLRIGDMVPVDCIVLNGSLEVDESLIAGESLLVRMVEEALGKEPKAINLSLAVLVVSCPCAFGIAVPLALTVGLFRLYRLGILIKDPSAFEKHIDLMVMDKTGTLTEGKPRLVKAKVYEEGALNIACGVAETSNHPYSLALGDYCFQNNVKPTSLYNCKEEVGVGVLCGEYLEFHFEDIVRTEAKDPLLFLNSRGIRVFMLTGDNEEKVRAVAQELGVKDFMARAKPEDKLRVVEEFQRKCF